jgi:hypothetical protein
MGAREGGRSTAQLAPEDVACESRSFLRAAFTFYKFEGSSYKFA